jgi:hypothetical protein
VSNTKLSFEGLQKLVDFHLAQVEYLINHDWGQSHIDLAKNTASGLSEAMNNRLDTRVSTFNADLRGAFSKIGEERSTLHDTPVETSIKENLSKIVGDSLTETQFESVVILVLTALQEAGIHDGRGLFYEKDIK